MLPQAPDTMPASGLHCLECGDPIEAPPTGWKAYIGGGFEDEPLEVAVFCPLCAEREFGET